MSTDRKRSTERDEPSKKKQRTDTIPILRGRFKERWLVKHSSLLKRSDEVTGIMVSCNVHAETRALGQVSTCLENYITKFFPECQSTWTRFEGQLDVGEIDIGEKESEKTFSENTIERKERKFQAVDSACGGIIFFRFRIDVKPSDFVIKFMDYLKQLPKEEKKKELSKISHSSVKMDSI